MRSTRIAVVLTALAAVACESSEESKGGSGGEAGTGSGGNSTGGAAGADGGGSGAAGEGGFGGEAAAGGADAGGEGGVSGDGGQAGTAGSGGSGGAVPVVGVLAAYDGDLGTIGLYYYLDDETIIPIEPSIGGFNVAPTGNAVVYNAGTTLYARTLPNGAPKTLSGSAQTDMYPSTAWSLDGTTVAFLATDGGTKNLYTATLTGTSPAVVASDVGNASVREVVLSEDGSHVVWLQASPQGIFAAPGNGTGAPALLAADGIDASFLPGTDRVIFHEPTGYDTTTIVNAAPDGSSTIDVATNVYQPGGGLDPRPYFEISPIGDRIAVWRDTDPSSSFRMELFTVAPDGTAEVRINPNLPTGGNVLFGDVFAPDGSRIAYIADQNVNSTYELFAANPDGTVAVTLSGSMGSGQGVLAPLSIQRSYFRWSPDSQSVAYVSNEVTPGADELLVVPGDGSAPPAVVSHPMGPGGNIWETLPNTWPMQWSADSKCIGYRADQVTDGTPEVFLAAAENPADCPALAQLPPGGGPITATPPTGFSLDRAAMVAGGRVVSAAKANGPPGLAPALFVQGPAGPIQVGVGASARDIEGAILLGLIPGPQPGPNKDFLAVLADFGGYLSYRQPDGYRF